MNHLMIDLETMGNRPTSAFTSISAVQFDPATGKTGAEFEAHVSLEDSMKAGLTVDASTVMWWIQQGEMAQSALIGGQAGAVALAEALQMFSTFIRRSFREPVKVWGNGATFDISILENAYRAVSLPIPWRYWEIRDLRTAVDFYPEEKKKAIFEGVKHYGLHDCYHQIKYLSAVWGRIYGTAK